MGKTDLRILKMHITLLSFLQVLIEGNNWVPPPAPARLAYQPTPPQFRNFAFSLVVLQTLY